MLIPLSILLCTGTVKMCLLCRSIFKVFLQNLLIKDLKRLRLYAFKSYGNFHSMPIFRFLVIIIWNLNFVVTMYKEEELVSLSGAIVSTLCYLLTQFLSIEFLKLFSLNWIYLTHVNVFLVQYTGQVRTILLYRQRIYMKISLNYCRTLLMKYRL
jgi:hypothetical protein